jgi:hypothetical protein
MHKMQQKNRVWATWSAVAATGAWALAGCGGQNADATLEGTWKISQSAMQMPTGVAGGSGTDSIQARGLAAARQALGNMTLQFRPDKTFTLAASGQMEGTYTFDGAKSVTLSVTKIGGQDISKMPGGGASPLAMSLAGQLEPDGSRLTLSNPGAGGGASSFQGLVFERPSQK